MSDYDKCYKCYKEIPLCPQINLCTQCADYDDSDYQYDYYRDLGEEE